MNRRRQDFWIGSALFLVGVLTRLPFRGRYLFHWDSVNFALALEHYDVRIHQPHPPGYFLYVMMGRAVQTVVDDGNAALVWLSVLGSALGVVAAYVLGNVMVNRRVGIVAGLLALTSPLAWFYGEVALSYSVEFALVTVFAALCYEQLRGERRWWPWTAALLGLAGGVRQNTLVFLLPLWLVCLWPLGWRERLSSLALLGLLTAGWLLPMVALSGGFDGYWTTLRGETAAVTRESSFLVPTQLAVNTGRMVLYLGYGLPLAALPLAWGAWQAIRGWRTSVRDRRTWILALWITPALLFYLVVHLRQHGHVFIFLPAVLLLSGWSIRHLSDKLHEGRSQRAVLVWGTAALLLVNVTFFLGAPASLLGSPRLPLQTPSWRTIKQRDHFLEARITAIETHFDPVTTAILAKGMYFRHPDYYLREFRHPGLSYQAAEGPVLLEDEVETLVLFDAQAEQLVDSTALLHVPLTTGDRLAYLHRPVQRTFVVSQDTIRFSSSP